MCTQKCDWPTFTTAVLQRNMTINMTVHAEFTLLRCVTFKCSFVSTVSRVTITVDL